MNNLKQISLANAMYSQNYDEWLVPVLHDSGSRWFHLLNLQMGRQSGDYKSTTCPSWDKVTPNNITCTIGVNMRVHGVNEDVYGDEYPMHKLSYIKNPLWCISTGDNRVNYNYDLYDTDFSYRHNERANLLYMDSHVESLTLLGVREIAGGSASVPLWRK